jgi:hypothetical protein
MYGENKKLITLQCPCCRKWVALRVDLEDVARHARDGVYVQDAFINADGRPYLSAAERELFLTCCADCWGLLCPSDKLAYS